MVLRQLISGYLFVLTCAQYFAILSIGFRLVPTLIHLSLTDIVGPF